MAPMGAGGGGAGGGGGGDGGGGGGVGAGGGGAGAGGGDPPGGAASVGCADALPPPQADCSDKAPSEASAEAITLRRDGFPPLVPCKVAPSAPEPAGSVRGLGLESDCML
jgi:hypothetical protein